MNKTLERLHERYLACMARAVMMRRFEVLLALSALAIPYLKRFLPAGAIRYIPLVLVAIAALSLLARYLGGRQRSLGYGCKQHVTQGYGFGVELPRKAVADLLETAKPGSTRLRRWSTHKPLNEYYTTSLPAGPGRLLEMCAESAYFSSRILGIYSVVLLATAIVTGALAFGGFYVAAIETAAQPKTFDRVADVLLSGVVVTIVLGAFQRSLDAHLAARAIRGVEDDVLSQSIEQPDEKEVSALARDYDAEVRAAPLVSPTVYRLWSNSLSRKWASRRKVVWGAVEDGNAAHASDPPK